MASPPLSTMSVALSDICFALSVAWSLLSSMPRASLALSIMPISSPVSGSPTIRTVPTTRIPARPAPGSAFAGTRPPDHERGRGARARQQLGARERGDGLQLRQPALGVRQLLVRPLQPLTQLQHHA